MLPACCIVHASSPPPTSHLPIPHTNLAHLAHTGARTTTTRYPGKTGCTRHRTAAGILISSSCSQPSWCVAVTCTPRVGATSLAGPVSWLFGTGTKSGRPAPPISTRPLLIKLATFVPLRTACLQAWAALHCTLRARNQGAGSRARQRLWGGLMCFVCDVVECCVFCLPPRPVSTNRKQICNDSACPMLIRRSRTGG